MSDTFTSSFSDILASNPQVGDLPTVSSADFSLPSNFFDNLFGTPGGAPLVAPVQNLPSTGSTGLTGLFSDAANLAASIYKGQAQVTQAKSAAQIAQANAARQAAASGLSTPLLFLAIAAAGILALRGGGGTPPVQSVVSTTRRGR